MKKTFITILIAAAACSGAAAQTAYDALLFSEKDYEGTARSMAMGNAFTALGGDLGSIGLNPAGSAVAGYSQVTITPSISISTNRAQGVLPSDMNGPLPYFQKEIKSILTGFSLPNYGFTLDWATGRSHGVKNVTFGFVVNRTGYWNEDIYAEGTNQTTSFMGSMAAGATADGLSGNSLWSDDAYDYNPWKEVVGCQSGMISTFGGHDNEFVGASEVIYSDNSGNNYIELGGPLNQTSGRRIQGSRYEYLINLGANISDFIYIGANLGITALEYNCKDYFKETAVDPSDFDIALDNGESMHFQGMTYKYNYDASSTGVYGKFGVLVTPGAGFRIGAAIQTPTATTVNEGWQHAGETSYVENKYNMSAKSPYGEDEYMVISPFRANFGLAYTLGQLAVISADYEVCNYGQMRYKVKGYDIARDYFQDLNDEIRTIFGASHMFRLGAEVKPVPAFSIRAGYDFTTSSEKEIPVTYLQNAAIGFGFSSKKSFYADMACRYRFMTSEYSMPYADYMFDNDGNITDLAPEILNRADVWKVVLTLGWRF